MPRILEANPLLLHGLHPLGCWPPNFSQPGLPYPSISQTQSTRAKAFKHLIQMPVNGRFPPPALLLSSVMLTISSTNYRILIVLFSPLLYLLNGLNMTHQQETERTHSLVRNSSQCTNTEELRRLSALH
jgi:hypothetical protein